MVYWKSWENGLYLGMLFLLAAGDSTAGDWEFKPQLGVGMIFTDNLYQSPPDQQTAAVVPELIPSFTLRRQGSRLNVNLDYTLQARAAIRGSVSTLDSLRDLPTTSVTNNLRGEATAELYKDHLFFNTSAYVTPVSTNSFGGVGGVGSPPGGVNSVLGQNTTTGGTYTLNPYWVSKFKDYADARVSYSYSNVLYGNNNVNASNSGLQTVNVDLKSGPGFDRLSWKLNYVYQYQTYQNTPNNINNINNTPQRNNDTSLEANYVLNREWALVAQGGYYDDSYTGINNPNGAFGRGGIRWTPNRLVSATATYGGSNNYLFSASFNPTERTTLEVTRSNQSVGTNAGPRWSGSLSHYTRNSTWFASYSEQTTNTQQQLASTPLFNQQGNPIIQPYVPFNLNNQNYLSKSFQAGVNYTTGRSQFAVSVYDQRQEYQNSLNNQNGYGANASWVFRLDARTSSTLSLNWQYTQYQSAPDSSYWVPMADLKHTISKDWSANLEYAYYRQLYSQSLNSQPLLSLTSFYSSYRENRITMLLQGTF
jgi:uncharacterized protein (PEP-CTERM system associated)